MHFVPSGAYLQSASLVEVCSRFWDLGAAACQSIMLLATIPTIALLAGQP